MEAAGLVGRPSVVVGLSYGHCVIVCFRGLSSLLGHLIFICSCCGTMLRSSCCQRSLLGAPQMHDCSALSSACEKFDVVRRKHQVFVPTGSAWGGVSSLSDTLSSCFRLKKSDASSVFFQRQSLRVLRIIQCTCVQ